ncbi:unnamed protein product [Protopolystoma xenopodis]|uniref:Uncharacterized protein n=1 Tax=Protopolystoma xenopodis TaxID=117903 RepID=A0A448WT30_9PLAT|nr:unnamed protein product [Protopolystoma xenopodis]
MLHNHHQRKSSSNAYNKADLQVCDLPSSSKPQSKALALTASISRRPSTSIASLSQVDILINGDDSTDSDLALSCRLASFKGPSRFHDSDPGSLSIVHSDDEPLTPLNGDPVQFKTPLHNTCELEKVSSSPKLSLRQARGQLTCNEIGNLIVPYVKQTLSLNANNTQRPLPEPRLTVKKANGDRIDRIGSRVVASSTLASIPMAPGAALSTTSSWLLRLFESTLFNMDLALQYLHKTQEPGVLAYLSESILSVLFLIKITTF